MNGLPYVNGLLLIFLTGAAGETCYSAYYSSITCYSSCCGSYYGYSGRYCCDYSSGSSSGSSSSTFYSSYTYLNIPLIVGLSVGGFFFIIIVIAVICACVKSGNKSGRVIGVQPVGTAMVSTTVASSQQGGYPGQVPQPPAYNAYPPPAAVVYPPPQHNNAPPSVTQP
ncbi:uncharacterized protein [Haliotis asinina]|uniref:uncharacterized protein n=1 Tax=Haliotis asinina TaxID=109174 RepID=UPI0035321918